MGERRESPPRRAVIVLLLLSTQAVTAGSTTPPGVPEGSAESPEITAHAAPAQGAPHPLPVWYLGHCGFALEIGAKLLVFDCLLERGYDTNSLLPRRRGDRWEIG